MQQKKELGFWMCTALVVGNTIGMGIFLLPASLAPYGLNAMLGWIVTVLGMTMLARVFARLAREFPAADGPYVYVESTVGKLPAFIAVWCYWVSTWVTNAALAIGVVGYLTAVVPALAVIPPALLSLGLVWVFSAVNLLGLRTGGRVQVATTAIKLLPMVAIVLLGVWLLLTDAPVYTRHVPTVPLSLGGWMASATIALYAMLGVESAMVPAGRIQNPETTIPRATMAGTLLVAVVYIAVSSMALLLIPQAELAQSSAPFAILLDRYVGDGVGRALAVFVVCSGLGALNGWTLLSGELTASMARHGLLPSPLAKLNGRGAPGVALVIIGVLATLMVLMNYSKSLVDGFTFLTLVVSAANLPLYLLCGVSLLVLWRRGAGKLPPGLLVPGALGTLYTLFASVGLGRETVQWALVLGAAGVPLYFLLRWRKPTERG